LLILPKLNLFWLWSISPAYQVVCGFFGTGLIIFATLSVLSVFQRAEIKRYENKNDEAYITTSLINKQ
jgi:hypothetical protein